MLLFHQEQNGLYRFDDQLTLMDYKLKQVLDRDGHSREIMQFVLGSATIMKHDQFESERHLKSSVIIEDSLENLKIWLFKIRRQEMSRFQVKQIKVRKQSEAIKVYA
ncbi:hypothetical protein ASF99_02740 [Exiguobacterium sp. Leaf187]|uniref:hypothetical protein n=2 Tax=unclassified Exiguobacterium TaxID=2644629 RepID=UPI0003C3D273|nr:MULTISPECIES: hypothetical protein [unclassified Exiguobacterium]AHA31405.1 hypothetical protein U719_08115 [Exiguobacterium sp. MH3]KQS18821.1 hypothetical protein ASF99_02740 [Exiguobacterium sp. Leaf187]NTY09445.1 hypothetical protein [Exiguobacterium sp. JMULE1]